jgi:hypothetical protein
MLLRRQLFRKTLRRGRLLKRGIITATNEDIAIIGAMQRPALLNRNKL